MSSVRVARSCPCVCSLAGKCPDPQTAQVLDTLVFFLFFYCPNTVFLVKDTMKQPEGERALCASPGTFTKRKASRLS